jgi:PAS domain S-box-containing protein
MSPDSWYTLRRYLLAVAIVAVTSLIWLSSTLLIGNRVSSSFFLMAIVVANRLGGYGPSWLALLLGAIPVACSQYMRTGLYDLGATVIIIVYVILGAILNNVMQSERVARQDAEQNAANALQKQQLLEREIAERTVVEQELRKAEVALRAQQTELRDNQEELVLALEAAHMGTWSLNLSTKEVQWSKTAEAMLGFVPGTFSGTFDAFMSVVHPDDRAAIIDSITARVRDRLSQQQNRQFRVVWPDGSIHWLESKGKPILDADGSPLRMIGVSMDITDRKEAENKLRTRESQLSGILDNASAVIYLKDVNGRYLLVNRRYRELFDHDNECIIGKTDLEWFPAPLAKAFQDADNRVWQTQAPFDCEEIAPHADGPHTYRSIKFPVRDESGNMIGLGGISTDISNLKDAHESLKAEQALLRNLLHVQENEKRLICYDIHDGMIQTVAGSIMLLEGYLKAHPLLDGSTVLNEAVSHLRSALHEGRRVIRGVRSTVLDDAGIVEAIEDLIDQMPASGIEVDFVHRDSLDRLPRNIETAIYRVTQEALTNARKHSGSDRIRIEMSRVNGRVRVEVRDFGRGFEMKKPRREALGILGMTERIRLLGGECTIESEIGTGTKVTAWLPTDGDESLEP